MAEPENQPVEAPQDGPPGAWLFCAAWTILTFLVLLISVEFRDEARRLFEEAHPRSHEPIWSDLLPYVLPLTFAALGALLFRMGVRSEQAGAHTPRCEHCHSRLPTVSAPCSTCHHSPEPLACEGEPLAGDPSPPDSEADDWRQYLHGRDIPCPHCRHNLRDGTTDRCPKCRLQLSQEEVREAAEKTPGEFWYPGVGRSPPRDFVPAWARRSAMVVAATLLWSGIRTILQWCRIDLEILDSYAGPATIVSYAVSFAAAWYCVVLLARATAWSARNPTVGNFVARLARPLVLIGLLVALAAVAAAAFYLHK